MGGGLIANACALNGAGHVQPSNGNPGPGVSSAFRFYCSLNRFQEQYSMHEIGSKACPQPFVKVGGYPCCQGPSHAWPFFLVVLLCRMLPLPCGRWRVGIGGCFDPETWRITSNGVRLLRWPYRLLRHQLRHALCLVRQSLRY